MKTNLILAHFIFLSYFLAVGETAICAEDPNEIPLVQGANGDKSSLFVHLPPPDKRNGTAMIICPGGGYGMLSLDMEGAKVADWLNRDAGVAGFVLKYRLPGRNGNPPEVIFEDAKAAIRYVRAHATELGIDPHRVGIMGFSAGGHVAVMAGTHYDPDTRPDFMMLIYPVISMGPNGFGGCSAAILGPKPDPEKAKFYSGELNVTKDTPPAFLTQSGDDEVVPIMGIVNFYIAMHNAHVPADLHIYEAGLHGMRGGKGWGVTGEGGWNSASWYGRALEWMKAHGLLTPTPTATPAPATSH